MSLTAHLDSSNSPVRKFIFETFSNTTGPLQECRRLAKDAPFLVPAPTVSASELGFIGAAFDYRLRYYFARTPREKLVAFIRPLARRRLTQPMP